MSLDGTGASGNTAEFTGMFNNDLPLITSILMSVEGGDGEWGFDNLEYGRIAAVPEPNRSDIACATRSSFGAQTMQGSIAWSQE